MAGQPRARAPRPGSPGSLSSRRFSSWTWTMSMCLRRALRHPHACLGPGPPQCHRPRSGRSVIAVPPRLPAPGVPIILWAARLHEHPLVRQGPPRQPATGDVVRTGATEAAAQAASGARDARRLNPVLLVGGTRRQVHGRSPCAAVVLGRHQEQEPAGLQRRAPPRVRVMLRDEDERLSRQPPARPHAGPAPGSRP